MRSTPRRFFRIAIFLLTFLICLYFFLHSSFFEIDKINVTGITMVSEQEVLEMSEIEIKQNLFEVNEQIASRSVELHPMVKKVEIIRHIPRTLEIKVTERVIWAVIPMREEFLIVDNEGVCIDKVSQFPNIGIPIITMEPDLDRVNLGQEVHPAGIHLIKKVWDGLSAQQRKSVSDFHYNADTGELLIYTTQGTEIKFGSDDRFKEKVALFDQVFELEQNFSENGAEVIEYVDIRFKGQPVVKTRT